MMPHFSSRVVPVVVIENAAHAVDLAQALYEGGIDVIEITLRSEAALAAIEAVARNVPQMQVGAGTLLTAQDVQRVKDAGAAFALSPGCSPSLVEAVQAHAMPFIPGVMTPSEVIQARDAGFRLMKLFPATVAGGLDMLKSLASPFSDVQFCPTGGINPQNMTAFLSLPNVAMVGGTWLTPAALMQKGDWQGISQLARQALQSLEVH